MKTTSELARRSAELALRRMSGIKTCGERFQIIAEESQSALDAQAAQHAETLRDLHASTAQTIKEIVARAQEIEAERDAALIQTAAIQAQWDAAMGDLKTLEAERERLTKRLTKYGAGLRLAVEGYDAQAAQYREAIKVATDALKIIPASKYYGSVAKNALAEITRLIP